MVVLKDADRPDFTRHRSELGLSQVNWIHGNLKEGNVEIRKDNNLGKILISLLLTQVIFNC